MSEVNGLATKSPVLRRNVTAVLATVAIVVSGWLIWRQVKASKWHFLQASGRSGMQATQRRATGSRRRSPQPNFDLTDATIPVNQILSGGPPKDGIPALTNAKFVAGSEASFLSPSDRVIGVAIGGEAKAYPLKILDHHEAVNDRLAGASFAVTYCPLCDSSAVFDRKIENQEYEFGISGLLFNSNVLLYDRAADGKESLWSQMASRSVAGSKSGKTLRRLPLEVTAWSDWLARHPKTLVLSLATGHVRSYKSRAYQSYFSSSRLMFPVEPLDKRLPAKTPVLGVVSSKSWRAYPIERFAEGPGGRIEDEIDGRKLTLFYDPQHESLRVEEAEDGLQWMYAYWFAWAAFYPETAIYQP